MTVIHIVLFKFKQEVSAAHRARFIAGLKELRKLPCVQKQQLVVGSPSITKEIERSKGFQIALLSFHADRAALDVYQASKEHHEVTSELLWPYKEDVVRFDFELDGGDLHGFEVLNTLGFAGEESS